jgi:hypothetical protein
LRTNTSEFLDKIKNDSKKYNSVFIFGNAPTLKLIDNEWVLNNKLEDTLTIGLNRSYLYLDSDYLFYTDNDMENYLKTNPIKNVGELIKITKNKNMEALRYWADTKMLFPKNTDNLILFRNTLISALHYCSLINAEKVILFGVQMDDRSYFYGKHPKGYDPKRVYDNSKLFGYDTHTIISETINYYFSKQFSLKYTGDSKFLESIPLSKIKIENVLNFLKS